MLAENPTVDVTCVLAYDVIGVSIRDDMGGKGVITFTSASGVECDDEGEPCPGDISGNGAVDFEDILIVLENWGGGGPDGDVNEDGIVNFEDILVILGTWGPCP